MSTPHNITEHTYRGYSFTVEGNSGTILTRNGMETLPLAHILTFIDSAWDAFDKARNTKETTR